jgi:hypothetical protein
VTHPATAHEKTQFVFCYSWGHSWDEYPNSTWVPEWGLPEVVRCGRCGTERRRVLNNAGEVLKGQGHYDYPEGYQFGPHERPTKAEFRILALAKGIEARKAARKRAMRDVAS